VAGQHDKIGLDLFHAAQFVVRVAQLGDGLFQVLDLARGDFQGEGGVVVRQRHTVAIQNQPAIGHDRHDRDTILLGQGLIMVMLENLQVSKARQQDQE
jgi:hypothetical protein